MNEEKELIKKILETRSPGINMYISEQGWALTLKDLRANLDYFLSVPPLTLPYEDKP